ncbi:MAG TPA: hypothetical protein VFK33_06480, partial [Bacillales bacterium]|nr:hypothetical protein [Bacillales bacterium]
IQIQNLKGMSRQPNVVIRNGALYILSTSLKGNSSAVLTVIDLKSGDVRYKGKIVEKNPASNQKSYKLFFHQLIVP